METTEKKSENTSSWMISGGIIAIVLLVMVYVLFKQEEPQPQVSVEPEPKIVEPIPEPPVIDEPVEVIPPQEITEVPEVVEIPEPEKPALPPLDNSDSLVQEKLAGLTWRTELLKLLINEDMIRRFVVFTDNFSQGVLAYEHSPFINPQTAFSVNESSLADGSKVLLWDDNSYQRFEVYVSLIRSIDSDTLVQWYIELKPLIDEAYEELGYPDEDFSDVLRDAIIKVLDMELPKERIELVQPSVMYRYKSEELEELDDSEKLLLRIGKENLLVIKSVLLEINEKLGRSLNQ